MSFYKFIQFRLFKTVEPHFAKCCVFNSLVGAESIQQLAAACYCFLTYINCEAIEAS